MFGTSICCFSRLFLLLSVLYLLAVPSEGWSQTTGYAPADQAAFDTLVVGKRTDWQPANAVEWVSPGRFSQTIAGVAYSGSYTYQRTGPNAGTTVFSYESGLTCTTRSTFTTATSGRASYTCSDGQSAGPFDWRLINGAAAPDHGNSRAQATRVNVNTETPGVLERARDVDYFRIDVAGSGSLTVETTGETDTVGYLQGATGQYLMANDNRSATDRNFRLVRVVTPGTYHVAVVGAAGRTATGAYTLRVRFTAGNGGSSADHGNSRTQATRVGLNTETAGALEQAGDVDYFRLEVSPAGRLTVETTGAADTYGYFGGATGGWLGRDDNTGAENNFRLVRDVTPGTYYVAIVGANGRRATGAYTLAVRFTAGSGGGGRADDHANARGQATSVAVNTATAGTLERARDVDYFRVTVTEAGMLTVETTGETDTYGYFGGATGGWLSRNDDASAADPNFRIVRQVTPGTYYVAVVGGAGRSATGAYTLRVRMPDGTTTLLDEATAVDLGSVTRAELDSGEADYYRIEVTRTGTVTVHTEGTVDTFGSLSPADDAWFAADDSGGAEENFRIVQQVTPGTYVVAVRGASEGDVGRYTFHVAFSSAAARSTVRIAPVAVEANSITTAALADGEVDYYRIEVPRAGALAVRTDDYTDTVGFLSPGSRTPLAAGWTGSLDDDGFDQGIAFQIAERVSAGTYYVAVTQFAGAYGFSDGYDDEYTLYVHYAPAGDDDRGNTILARARRVEPNSTTSGVLADAMPDFYRIDVSGSGTLTVETTGNTQTVGMLSPLDDAWFSPAKGDAAAGFRIVQSVSAGTYIVAVAGVYNDTGPYTLRVRFAAGRPARPSVRVVPLRREPDSTTRVEPSGGSAEPGLASYHRIDVPRAGTLTLSTAGSSGTVGLVLPGNRTPLDNRWLVRWNDGRTGDFRIVERVSAGTYLVIVNEKDGDPYTFTSRFAPDPS